nr:MAG: hypothetical protein [Caudoviricetes sp.]
MDFCCKYIVVDGEKMNIIILILILLPFSVNADTENLFGQWTALFVNGKFGKDSPWNYMFEANIRSSEYPKSYNNDGFDIGSVPIRLGVGYQIDKENSVIGGYLFQYSDPPYAKYSVYENRVWEQYMNIQDYKEYGKLQLRSRFEQRTITSDSGVGLRIRQQVKYSYPIDKKWGLAISEEVFVNCNTVSWGPVEGFDQNRLFIGPYVNINDNVKVEMGYQNVFVSKDLVDDQMNHIMAINLYYNVPD